MAFLNEFTFPYYSALLFSKIDDFDGENFVDMCYSMRWDDVQRIIKNKPSLIWTARKYSGDSPAHFITKYGNIEMLEMMASLINQQPQESQRQILFDAFERSNENGVIPLHNAASNGDVQCLKFLVQHCPSGPSVLEIKDCNGWMAIHYAIRYYKIDAMKYILQNTPGNSEILEEKNKNNQTMAHFTATYGSIDSLEFILRNSPSGIAMLSFKNDQGKTPLEVGGAKLEQYFTQQKICEIGLENEMKCLADFFDSDSLISIMFGVIQQNIETQIYRLRRYTS